MRRTKKMRMPVEMMTLALQGQISESTVTHTGKAQKAVAKLCMGPPPATQYCLPSREKVGMGRSAATAITMSGRSVKPGDRHAPQTVCTVMRKTKTAPTILFLRETAQTRRKSRAVAKSSGA